MKNYKYLLLVSTCLLFNNNSTASELDLTFNSSSLPLGINTTLHTHTPNVELKPISNFVKLAAVCSVTGEGCQGLGFGSNNNDINLDNATQCKDEGYGTSCPSGYVPDTSQKCPHNNNFYKCRPCSHSCSSGSLAYCNSNQLETGSFRNDCGETCYTCRTKTCADGGYSSSINSCQKASSINYAGNTCYTSVVSKTCADGGYNSSIPANQVGQSTSYCGNTCYSGVRTPACSEGGFKSSIPTNQACTSTTYYGQTCYKDCYTPNCGAGGYNASIPANNICSSINYYGQTCYKDCYQPACSAGGFLASCPANHSCTTTSYYGRTCYTDGGQPSCSAGGYNSSIPSNNLCSSVNYYGQTCYKDCYTPACSTGGFEATIPSGKTCTSTSYYGQTCYNNCVNSCVPNSCSEYDLRFCPIGALCLNCNVGCGDNSTKYKIKKCEGGYTLQDGFCTPNSCSDGGYSDFNEGGCLSTKYGGKTCYKCSSTSRPELTPCCNGGRPDISKPCRICDVM